LPKKYKKITLDQLKILHYHILENQGQSYIPLPPSKEKDLQSILDNIDQYVYGKELYPTICDKAMYILMRIEQSQAFPDGNKRVALAACELFLNINGSSFNSRISQKTKIKFMLALATNKITKGKAVKCCIEAIRN